MNVSPLKYDKLIALKITQEDFNFLQRYSKADGTSVSELVRNLIEQLKYFDEIKQPKQEPRNLLKEFLA